MSRPRKYPKAKPGSKIDHHPAAKLLYDPDTTPFVAYLLNFDGGCDRNGDPDATGTWGWTLRDPRGEEIAFGNGRATAALVTVNTAEWEGLLGGLRFVLDTAAVPPPNSVRVLGDSDLVVSQLLGRWKARDVLAEYRDECLGLLYRIGRRWTANWIPRDQNGRCDELTRTVDDQATPDLAAQDAHLRAIAGSV